jgi:hypothetical protein
MQVLGKLIGLGISCTPTTALRRWVSSPGKSKMENYDRSCFPWAVVEMKKGPTKDRASIERCYCQAANGAAAALEMQEKLFDRLGHEAFSKPPPIVAFTCIGPIVKVWLAYQDKGDASQRFIKASISSQSLTPITNISQRMVCIWTTSVLLTWGVASLRAIVMNMHTWASRLLKPKLQACVYGVSEGLRRTEQSGSQSPCARQPRHASCTPVPSTTESSSESARESELVARSKGFIPVTSLGQQTNVADCSQSGSPRRAVLREAPTSCDAQSSPPNGSASSPCSDDCDSDTGSTDNDTNSFGVSCTTPTSELHGRATSGNTSQEQVSSHSRISSNATASGLEVRFLGARLPIQNGARLPWRLAKQQTVVSAVTDAHSDLIWPLDTENIRTPSGFHVSSSDSEIVAKSKRIFGLTPSKVEISYETSMVRKASESQKIRTGSGNAEISASCSPLSSNRLGDSNTISVAHRDLTSTSSNPSDNAKAGGNNPFFPSNQDHSPKSGGLLHHFQSEVGSIWDKLERNAVASPKSPFGKILSCDQKVTPMASGSESFDNSAQEKPPELLFAGAESSSRSSSSSSSVDFFGRNATPTPTGSSCRKEPASRDVADSASAGTRDSSKMPRTPNGDAECAFRPGSTGPSTTLQLEVTLSGPDSDDSRGMFGLQQIASFEAQTASNAMYSSIPMSAVRSEDDADTDSGSGIWDQQSSVRYTDTETTSMIDAEWLVMMYENQ